MTMVDPQQQAPTAESAVTAAEQANQVTPSPALPVPQSAPDVAGIDSRLRHITGIEAQWGLPNLPDETKIDLAAAPGATHEGLSSFLWGIAHDVNQALDPLAAQPAAAATLAQPTAALTPASPSSLDPSSPFNQARQLFAGLSGEPAPSILDPSAVSNFKSQAISAGLLPASTPVNDAWDPSLGQTLYQLSQSQFQSRMAGSRPGSISAHNAINLLGELVDPKTLLGAAAGAVLHSFVPTGHDVGGFVHSFSSWIHDPFSGSKLLGMLRSSVPVALPIITDALMLTGAGEIIGTVRAIGTGAEAIRGLYAAGRAGEELGAFGNSVGRFVTSATEGQSFLGTQLAGRGFSKTASLLDQWRNLPANWALKNGVRQVYKVGAAANVGSILSPATSDYAQSVDAYKNKVLKAPGLWGPALDVMGIVTYPPYIFRPHLFQQVGRVPQALISRLGAVADENGQHTMAVIRGLARSAEPASPLAQGLKGVRGQSPTDLLADHIGGDKTDAGHLVSFLTYSAAVDKRAKALSNLSSKDMLNPNEWKPAYLAKRSQVVGQLIHVHEGDVDTFAHVMSQSGDPAVRQEAEDIARQIRAGDTTLQGRMNEMIRDHQDKRADYAQALISDLHPSELETYVADQVKNPTFWNDFHAANSELRSYLQGEGVLDAPGYIVDETGRPLYTDLGYEPAYSPNGKLLGGLETNKISDGLKKAFLDSMTNGDLSQVKQSLVQQLYRRIVPGDGRFALGRIGEARKQDAIELLATVKGLQRHVKNLSWLDRNPAVQAKLADFIDTLDKPLGEMNPSVLGRKANEHFAASEPTETHGLTPKGQAALQSLRAASQQYQFDANDLRQVGDQRTLANLTDARTQFQSALDELDQSSVWQDKFGLRHLDPSTPLSKKVKELTKAANYLAGRVEGIPDVLRTRLADLGYEVVHGQEFFLPQDMANLVSPFAEMSRAHMHRLSLGAFFTPMDGPEGEALGKLLTLNLHSELNTRLGRLGLVTPEDTQRLLQEEDPGLSGQIIARLSQYRRDQGALAEQNYAAAKTQGAIARIGASFKNSTVPQSFRDIPYKVLKDIFPEYAGRPEVLNAIQKSILESYKLGFRYNGLADLEDRLRSVNVLTKGLNVLGKTPTGGFLARGVKPIVASSAAGAAFQAGSALASGDTSPTDLAAQAGAGALHGAEAGVGLVGARTALRRPAAAALTRVENANWARYGNLPNWLARIRNYMRFTINPFFDARRYVKGAYLSQAIAGKDGQYLPLNNSLRALAKEKGDGVAHQAVQEWDAASKGEYGALEDTERYYLDRGFLGFSAREHMAATYHRLVHDNGMAPEDAATMTRKIWAYGQGRSAAEKSVNFMFFPFSFEKKVISNTAKFLGDDLTRLVMLHDAMKTYDLLNQHYNLNQVLAEHVPLAQELQTLNAFAEGLNMGELGGVNRPLLNLFLPVGLSVTGHSQAMNAQALAKRLGPAYTDIANLVSAVRDQGHVLFSPSHLTTKAEADTGFAKWAQIKQEYDSYARKIGYRNGWGDIQTMKALAPIKDELATYKAQLMAKYPAWADSLAQYQDTLTKNQQTIDEAVAQVSPDLMVLAKEAPTELPAAMDQLWSQPQSYERDLALFYAMDQAFNTMAKQQGYSVQYAPEDLPPQAFDWMRQWAVQLSAGDSKFATFYKRFWQSTYGPIERSLA